MSYRFDYASINVSAKSNEANMRAVKAYLDDLTDRLNIYMEQIEERMNELESKTE